MLCMLQFYYPALEKLKENKKHRRHIRHTEAVTEETSASAIAKSGM
jgi:hypothetical protein